MEKFEILFSRSLGFTNKTTTFESFNSNFVDLTRSMPLNILRIIVPFFNCKSDSYVLIIKSVE